MEYTMTQAGKYIIHVYQHIEPPHNETSGLVIPGGEYKELGLGFINQPETLNISHFNATTGITRIETVPNPDYQPDKSSPFLINVNAAATFVPASRAVGAGIFQVAKHPWREAGPPNHLDDKVDSDQ